MVRILKKDYSLKETTPPAARVFQQNVIIKNTILDVWDYIRCSLQVKHGRQRSQTSIYSNVWLKSDLNAGLFVGTLYRIFYLLPKGACWYILTYPYPYPYTYLIFIQVNKYIYRYYLSTIPPTWDIFCQTLFGTVMRAKSIMLWLVGCICFIH